MNTIFISFSMSNTENKNKKDLLVYFYRLGKWK